MEISLTREQRVFLLTALSCGRIDIDGLDKVGLSPRGIYNNMTEEELREELVKLAAVGDHDETLVERCCKKRYESGCGCYLANAFRRCGDKDAAQMIRGMMLSK